MTKGTDPGRDGYVLRSAAPGDGPAIISVFREAMPEAVVAVNVLGTTKAAAFVDHSIAASETGGSDLYWVAQDATDRVVGFAQLRLGRSTTFVNNLHVAVEHQGRGIGDRLMRLMTGALTSDEVAADVFASSEVSRRMFERAGFEAVGTYYWRMLESASADPGWFTVHDLPQADAAHQAFGLSVFRIETSASTHSVGRIGSRLYRLVGEAASDPYLPAVLHRLEPNRSILAIVPAEGDAPPGEPYLVSRRFAASRAAVTRKYGT